MYAYIIKFSRWKYLYNSNTLQSILLSQTTHHNTNIFKYNLKKKKNFPTVSFIL